jgi:PIN domain nuclease of toxin-antitoxin system
VRLLLDTHAVLWWFSDDPRLSRAAAAAFDSAENDLFLSAVSGYEIVYKQNSGRLPSIPDDLARRLQRASITVLPLSFDHALAAALLPGPHRDPWDRIMMAQALAERLTVVTVDPQFAHYGIPVLW